MDIKKPILIIIQIIISVIIIISAFVIKTIGGDIHAFIGTWFFENYNNSIFTDTSQSPLDFIEETIIIPNTGKIEVIGYIIYPYKDIKEWTTFYHT